MKQRDFNDELARSVQLSRELADAEERLADQDERRVAAIGAAVEIIARIPPNIRAPGTPILPTGQAPGPRLLDRRRGRVAGDVDGGRGRGGDPWGTRSDDGGAWFRDYQL